MKVRAAMPLLALALLAARTEKPTGNGDPIGTATSDRNGQLTLQLRSVQCDGMIVEGMYHLSPADADYPATLAWIGGISPGETKPVHAQDVKPCRKPGRRR